MGGTVASSPRAPSLRESAKRLVFWNYGGLYVFYFAIWQIFFTFHGLRFKEQGGSMRATSASSPP